MRSTRPSTRQKSKFDAVAVNVVISHQLAAYFAYFHGQYDKIPAYRQAEIKQVNDLLGRLKADKNRIKTYQAFFEVYDDIINHMHLKNALFEWWLPSRLKRHLLLGRAVIQMRLGAKLKVRCPECFDEDEGAGSTGVTLRQFHDSLRDKCQRLEETIEQHQAVIEGLRNEYGHDAVNAIQMFVIRERNLIKSAQLDASVASAEFATDASGEEYSGDEVDMPQAVSGEVPMQCLKQS